MEIFLHIKISQIITNELFHLGKRNWTDMANCTLFLMPKTCGHGLEWCTANISYCFKATVESKFQMLFILQPQDGNKATSKYLSCKDKNFGHHIAPFLSVSSIKSSFKINPTVMLLVAATDNTHKRRSYSVVFRF